MFLHFLTGGFTGNIMTIDVQQAAEPARSTGWSVLRAAAAVKEILVLLCDEMYTDGTIWNIKAWQKT